MATFVVNCVIPIIKVKINPNEQPVHFGSSKPLHKLTFVDLGDLFNKDGNSGIDSNLSNACERKMLFCKGQVKSCVGFFISTNIVHYVVDLLKIMFQIWHTYNKSRSLDYATMKIEVINFSW